jgi:hypothetical protein
MNRHTGELVNALHGVSKHVPRVVTDLLAGTLSVAKQHEFAGLLVELGELLHSHAADQESGIISGGPADTATAPARPASETGDEPPAL